LQQLRWATETNQIVRHKDSIRNKSDNQAEGYSIRIEEMRLEDSVRNKLGNQTG
jgi:hypothetical protein